MKIVCIDNFNRDTVSDTLLAENVPNEPVARCMADALNAKFSGDDSAFYAVVKPDDYELFKWEP